VASASLSSRCSLGRARKMAEEIVRKKLEDKAALIRGGDSGIGRAVAVAFAQEGAGRSFVYLNEHEDAKETERRVRAVAA
jgi:shikimate 5-dehydrogenase